MEEIKLSKELASVLKLSHDIAQIENLSSITSENVTLNLIEYYLQGKGNNEALNKFFSDNLTRLQREELLDRAKNKFGNSKILLDIPEKYRPDQNTGIPLSDDLKTLFTISLAGKRRITIFNDSDEIDSDIFFLTVLEDPKCDLIDGMGIGTDSLRGYIRALDFTESITNKIEEGVLKEKRIEPMNDSSSEDSDDPGLADFLRNLGLGDNSKTEEENRMRKDDEDFNAVGESKAVSGMAVDPNSKTPFLDQFSFDMTKAAKDGKYDPMIGRERELEQVIKILSCRKKNNAVLLGVAGCGKSSMIEGLSQRIIENKVPLELQGKRVCSLDLNALVSGTKYRGEYEERLQGIIKEVIKNKEIIVYIDEFHNLIGNGGTSGSGDGANILKPYLARGEFQCIASTTQEEYRKFVKDAALKRRFQTVQVEEPGKEETFQILKGLAPKYEEFHHVKYSQPTLRACIEMASRYINDRFFPDKAIDLMDTAGAQMKLERVRDTTELDNARAKIEAIKLEKQKAVQDQDFELAAAKRDEQLAEQKNLDNLLKSIEKTEKSRKSWPEVSPEVISKVIANLTGIPVDQIGLSDLGKLKAMKDELSTRVIGQKEAVTTFVSALQRNSLGLRDETKPIASILLSGPSGTGKTLICEEVAKRLFGSESSFIKFNMGEFTSEHEASKLIGSPAGYVGYEDEPLLLQVKRHEHSLVLFDEVEKSHPKIYDLFLNMMDKGFVTLSNGENVDFRNAIVVFTGNIGTKEISKLGSGLGFNKATDSTSKNKVNEDVVMKAIKKTFRPEFINRLTNIVTFNELGKSELKEIFTIEFGKLKDRLKKRGFSVKVGQAMKDHIVDLCDTNYGARDLQRNIQKCIEAEICAALLAEEESELDKIIGIQVDWKNDKAAVTFNKKN